MEVKSNFNIEAAAAASREELQAAIAKAVELRAIHTALHQQGASPETNSRFMSSPPPPPNHPKISSAIDYPVFTPSYEDEPLPGYRSQSRAISPESWEDYGLVGVGRQKDAESSTSYMIRKNSSYRKGTTDYHYNNISSCPVPPPPPPDLDCRSVTSSCTNPHHHISALQASSPLTDVIKSRRRNSLGDLNSVCSSCSKCNNDHDNSHYNCSKHPSSNIVVPLTDSHSALHSHHHHQQQQNSKSRGLNLSWLFPRSRKKKNTHFRDAAVLEEISQMQILTSRDHQFSGVVSIETLKKQLLEANQQKDSALSEVMEMRSSFGDLKRKLETLEKYCEDLKKALKQAVNSKQNENITTTTNNTNTGNDSNTTMPVSEEVMVEGFLQMVSESRLSVKQFCKTLVEQIESADDQLIDNLNSILQPYKLSIAPRYMKAVIYHLEAMVNLALYQDFENCVFQMNGCPNLLDPEQARQAQFASFVALRNLSWNEVLKKGTKYYSEEFSRFCDQKMSCVISTLNWIRPWPEQLLQSFFVAAKCIWLLHLLAFSFSPPLSIMRVEDNRAFDVNYMEDMLKDHRQQKRSSASTQGPSRVKIMVTPGFYVKDKILRCKVICKYKSSFT